MSHNLYRGLWPQNVSRLAKYAVKFDRGDWRVAVLYDVGDGLRYLAVESGGHSLATQVNAVKLAHGAQPGGAFYINEFRHVVVPVGVDRTPDYYFAGRFDDDLAFTFEGKPLTCRPVNAAGAPLQPGDPWVGPRPAIPYVLAAGGSDIYFESPALTDADPPTVRENVTRKVKLSAVLRDKGRAARAAAAVSRLRGYPGGRFYVNEYGAMFTPIDRGDGDGLDYIYCGQIDRNNWFDEPRTT